MLAKHPSGLDRRAAKYSNENIAESHSQVTILFVDIVSFTALSETMQPSALHRLGTSLGSTT
jgi:class 3 adenylate cyclase